MPDDEPPITPQVPNIPPPPMPQPPKNSISIVWTITLLLLGILIGAGSLWGYQSYVQPKGTLLGPYTPKLDPEPIPTDPKFNWKTYIKDNYQVRYPDDWSVKTINFGFAVTKGDYEITIQTSNPGFGPGICIFSDNLNYNNPYDDNPILAGSKCPGNFVEFSGDQYIFRRKTTSSVSPNGISTGKWTIYVKNESGEFVTVPPINYSSPATYDLSTIELMDQILSTFTFIKDSLNLKPTPSSKTLNYLLPIGWKTVQDKTGTFEVGYDPQLDTIYDVSINDLSIGFSKTSQYGGISYDVMIKPYDGGSRHSFILGPGGIQEQDKLPGYHEENYVYNGWSCLVLYGVSISQWPQTQGMCAIDSKRAFAIGLWKDEADTEKIISTIKLLQ